MRRIICFFKKHKGGKSYYKGDGIWHIECRRCGYELEYKSPHARLVGEEMRLGFDGQSIL